MTISRRSLFGAAMAMPLAGPGMAWAAGARGRPEIGTFGLDLAAIDPAIAPGDDFYRHTNNGWLKANSIPPDRSGYRGPIQDRTDANVRAIMETAGATGAAHGRKITDYYAAWTDEAALERLGLEPLKPELAQAAAVNAPGDLARALARLSYAEGRSGSTPIPAGVGVDVKQPTRYTPMLGQGGLCLPDRDYYLIDTPANLAARRALREHLARMFQLAGFDDAEGRAARVYALEDRIARGHRSREANRQAEARYNPFSRTDLASRAPGLDWDAFLSAAGFDGRDRFIVASPQSLTASAGAARDVPLTDWRDYLAFRAIRNFAPCGPKAFRAEDFAFNNRALYGTPQPPPVWRQAVAQTDRALGQAVGQIYLAQHFPAESRTIIEEMTRNLKAAMARRIRSNSWMSVVTRDKALTKLAALRVEVGGQTPPRDYAALEVKPGEAYGNLLRLQDVSRRRALARLDQPVDRSEWSMNGHTINAASNQTLVKVMFPAGYLQPPNFDPHADPAVNYGAIGRVIGHEISHQFDDQGSKYDATGALNNWWAPEDLSRFRAATLALAAQYDTYEPLPGLHINGRLTLGENIGDLAGLSMALDAYHASLGGRPAPVLGGLTGDQRFFLSYAQAHRSLQRDAALRQQIISDPHSPNEWRTAQVRNLDAWYAAFDVKPGHKMYLPPEQRVRVW